MKTGRDVVDAAMEVLEARTSGLNRVIVGGVEFATKSTATSKFIRRIHQAVTGIEWPEWSSVFPVWTERLLRHHLYTTELPYPGCIVCFNSEIYSAYGERVWNLPSSMVGQNGVGGHCAIYVDKENVIECADVNRGTPHSPGVKITPYREIGKDKISGFYGVLPQDSIERKYSVPDHLSEIADVMSGLGISIKNYEAPVTYADLLEIFEKLGIVKDEGGTAKIEEAKEAKQRSKKDGKPDS
jgi:hypothetical protein